MHTEADFQDALDLDVTDWQLRLVFSDWLEERDDSRAAGYRALGQTRKWPLRIVMNEDLANARHDVFWILGRQDNVNTESINWMLTYGACLLPTLWYKKIPICEYNKQRGVICTDYQYWHYEVSRKAAEDAAASAFLLLSPDHQHQLLAI